MTNENTILLVEDDLTMQDSIADYLRLSGYQVITADNGVQAFQFLQSQTPDLIVSDIMMPQMDGHQFFEMVRENPDWVSIPFIFLTAKGEKKDIRRGYSLGADDYLIKPFEAEDLLIAVRNRLKRVVELKASSQSEVERTKKQLMDIFGHELRTPLSLLHGFFTIFEEKHDSPDDDATREITQILRQNVTRLTKLVEDLMLVMTLESGLAEIESDRFKEPVDISLHIEEVIEFLRHNAEKKGITISLDIQSKLQVLGIPMYIKDLFSRLIENGIKFGKQEGHLWIQVEGQGDQGVVSIRDDGIGIPADRQKKLFERFEQIDREMMEQQGVGLGLALAKRLANLHGGDIHLESQPGQGSTFTVTLPLYTGET